MAEDYVSSVLKGNIINNVVMNDLQARAIINRERYVNAYGAQRMQEVVECLAK